MGGCTCLLQAMVDPKGKLQRKARSWHSNLLVDVAAALEDVCKLLKGVKQPGISRETVDGLLKELLMSISRYEHFIQGMHEF
jgi:hypothetical protein